MQKNERNSVNVLGVNVDRISMPEALETLESFIRQKSPRIIATANAEMIMMAQNDTELLGVLNAASLVLPDGAGVVWAAGKLGFPVPERVAGFDLTQRMLQRSAQCGYRIYWLGASPGVAEAANARASSEFPGLVTVGIRDGYFLPEDSSVIDSIREAKPDILLCALGVPKQEKWLFRNLEKLNVAVTIGVGGTFDVMAGKVTRAPVWMQQAGLEWLYRLLCQPTRFVRMLALPRFVLRVLAVAWTTR